MDIALLTLLSAVQTTFITFVIGGFLGALYAALVFLFALFSDSSPDSLREFALVVFLACFFYIGIPLIIGGAIGSILGALAGAATGIVTAAITMLAFFPLRPNRARLHRVIITTVGVVINFAAVYLLGFPLYRWIFSSLNPSEPQSPLEMSLFSLIPSVIAGVAAWWIGRRMAKWYERQPQNSPKLRLLIPEVSPESPAPAQTSMDLD